MPGRLSGIFFLLNMPRRYIESMNHVMYDEYCLNCLIISEMYYNNSL